MKTSMDTKEESCKESVVFVRRRSPFTGHPDLAKRRSTEAGTNTTSSGSTASVSIISLIPTMLGVDLVMDPSRFQKSS